MDMDILEGVVRLETTLWNLVERGLVQRDLPGLGTYLALKILHGHGGSGRVHDLSRELSITIGAASKVADRLERTRLAERRPHPTDRRSSLISLTDEGERARAASASVVQRVVDNAFGDDDLVAAGVAMLARLQGCVDSATAKVAA
jgi:MarR family transcriptional regulator, multiple antibiotic resistance protein MarR